MKKAGALQHAGKAGNKARAAARNLGTILAIPDIAGAEFSCAASDGGQAGAADQGRKFPVENLVAEAEFAALTCVEAQIETAAGSFVAENRNASLSREFVAGHL